MMLLMMIVLIRKGNTFLLLYLLMKAHATFFHIDGKKTCTRTHARTPRQGEYSRLYIIVTAMCKSASPTLIRVMIVAQVLRRVLFFFFFSFLFSIGRSKRRRTIQCYILVFDLYCCNSYVSKKSATKPRCSSHL